MKRLLLAPILLTLLFGCGSSKLIPREELVVLFCAEEQNKIKQNIYSEWDWSPQEPWIVSRNTGKIYIYVPYINEIRPLKVLRNGDLKFTYDSKLKGNIIEVKGNWTSNGKPSSSQKFRLDLNAKTETSWILSSGSNVYDDQEINNSKLIMKCIESELPKGVKIKY